MVGRRERYRGCLLGMAIGDAMGYTVDERTREQIWQDYGPMGLMGYDLVNGYADISSYTQLAAYACNGLLLGQTRGQMRGVMAPYVRYIALGEREWAMSQRYTVSQERTFCWIYRMRELRGRHCMDTRMLDTINRDRPGSMEEPHNRFNSTGAVTVAVPVGLFFNPGRTERPEIDRLGAEAIALTHGDPQTFLTGFIIAHMISRITWDGVKNLRDLAREACMVLQEQMGREYRQTVEIKEKINLALALAISPNVTQADAMEQLHCETAAEVLAGAIYAAVSHPSNFDEAVIASVNHSGRSAACSAITGAIMGALLGEQELPDFYLDPLEPGELLRELADDMYCGCPMDSASRLFDDEWDRKYIHGGV